MKLHLLNDNYSKFIGKKTKTWFFGPPTTATADPLMLTFLTPVPSEPRIIKSFSGVTEKTLLVHGGRVFEVKSIKGSSTENFLVCLFTNIYWTLKWNVISSTIWLAFWTPDSSRLFHFLNFTFLNIVLTMIMQQITPNISD